MIKLISFSKAARLILVFAATFLITNVYAQKRVVSGKVTEQSTNEPIPGVNILE